MTSRFDAIKANLRRRDNIRHFVAGLEDSECWPYPEHQNGASVAAAPDLVDEDGNPIVYEVAVDVAKRDELTVLYLPNVNRPMFQAVPPQTTLVDLAVELMPADGPGAYVLDYEIVEGPESRAEAPQLSMEEVNELRSSFMHRYDWVASKVHSVNLERQAAIDELLDESDNDSSSESTEDEVATTQGALLDNEEPLSEEEDFDEV